MCHSGSNRASYLTDAHARAYPITPSSPLSFSFNYRRYPNSIQKDP
jgi:hypothetical protein